MGVRMGRMVPNEKTGIPSIAFGKCYIDERRQAFLVVSEPICEPLQAKAPESTNHESRMFEII